MQNYDKIWSKERILLLNLPVQCVYARVYIVMIEFKDIRNLFPALSQKVYGKDLVYLDNAATSQRLASSVELWKQLAEYDNANIHRAVHNLSAKATHAYENARDKVKEYLNAEYREEIVFTSGTTSAINLVAFSFGEAFVAEGDEVIVTEAEHHSNIVPWQMMCQRKKATLKVLPIADDGYLQVEKLEDLITSRTKILAVTHISNVLGLINPVEQVISICHSKGVPVLVDGAQGIVHCPVDVQKLDCDFYVFSGHKMYAATGTGVLYGKKKWLDMMPPYMGGGEMVGTVSFEKTTYAPLPMKYEAGTQNFNSIPTLVPALDFLKETIENDEIRSNSEAVARFVFNELRANKRIRLFGVPRGTFEDKIPLFSFVVEGVHHEDLALILDKMGVAVRSGQMCAEPLMDRMGVTGMLRASFAPYNTMQEAEYFIKCLNKAIAMLE